MTITNAQRRKNGLRRLEVWLPEESIRRMDELAAQDGDSRADMIRGWIDEEWDENQSREEWREARAEIRARRLAKPKLGAR